MFCKKCGSPLEPETKFCAVCGTPTSVAEEPADGALTAEAPAAESFTAAPVLPELETPGVSDAECEEATFSPAPKKNSILKKILVPVIAVVAVIVLSIVCYAAIPGVNNWVNKAIMSPEDYFKHVVKSNFKDGAADVSGFIAEYQAMNTAAQSGEANLKLTVGDGLKNAVKEYGGAEAAQAINWVNTLDVDAKTATADYKTSGDFAFSLNGAKIVSMNMAVDAQNGDFYFTVPELNSTTIKASNDRGYYSGPTPNEIIAQIVEIIPEEKVTNKLLNRYMECVVEQIDDVDEETDAVEAGDVTQKLTKLTAEIDQETMVNVAIAVLEEAQEDKDLKKIINDIEGLEMFEGEDLDLYDDFQDGIDDVLDDLEDIDDFSDESVDFIIWVNGSGEIVGMGMEVEDTEMSAVYVEKGKNFGAVIAVKNGSNTVFAIEGDGTKSGDKYTGEFDMEVQEAKLAVLKVENFDKKKAEDGLLNGKFTFELSDGAVNMLKMTGADSKLINLLSTAKLVLTSTAETKNQTSAELALYTGDTLWASISGSGKTTDGGTVTIPANFIDATNDSAMESWASNVKLDTLLANLKSAGLPTEMSMLLENAINPPVLEAPDPADFELEEAYDEAYSAYVDEYYRTYGEYPEY